MKDILILCNTVYQIIVATWIVECYYKNDNIDIIISDHMNEGKKISENIKNTDKFRKVYYSETLEYARWKGKYHSRIYPKWYRIRRLCPLGRKYDEILIANLDAFSQLIYPYAIKDGGKLYLYEDGTATYSKVVEKYYNSCKSSHRQNIYGNVKGIYLFTPNHMCWKPDFDKIKIPYISRKNKKYIEFLNKIFDYANMRDVYDKKYIFMEESYAADGIKIDDVELVKNIANIVGKENIMVKIHPRNRENRFYNIGFKTNINTSIPWELIILNNDFSDKVLITIASSSVLNPIILFGEKAKVRIMYKCLNNKPNILKGDLWECICNRMKYCGDNLKICRNINDVVEK